MAEFPREGIRNKEFSATRRILILRQLLQCDVTTNANDFTGKRPTGGRC